MCPYIYITLPSYGVMAFIGAFAVLMVIYFRLDKYQVPFDVFLKYFFASVIGGFLGSKLLFAITQIPELIADFSVENLLLLIPQSGFVFYGGLFGVLCTIRIGTKENRCLRQRIYRMIAPAIPLFHGFGRIGCMLAGCCYGRKLQTTVLLFGIFELKRIPVQMIESVYEFFLCVVIFAAEKNKKMDGLKLYLTAYGIFRFVIEFFRGDAVRGIFLGMSTAQWISLFILGYYLGKRFFTM
ncbi:MAG: prolipoprotein diacylglyceryl transferase [Lachnospiraceae bacterium]|nr:prolipoprotein diacylglyceryl transferase [Lachnospiraceae bacterium]